MTTPPGPCDSVDEDLVAVVGPAVAVEAVEVKGDAGAGGLRCRRRIPVRLRGAAHDWLRLKPPM